MDLSDKKELVLTAKALASETRIDILKLLCEEQLNVNEIAERLKIPASSAAVNIKVLEEGGLIRTELQPGIRGSMKVCYKNMDECNISVSLPKNDLDKTEIINMPIGNYVDYLVTPTCGMVSENGPIDEEDQPRCFYNPDRTKAKLIWFRTGYVEYRFPNAGMQGKIVKSIEISAELCSEAADYDLNCKSDITMWINGRDAGTWTSPSDFGGRRGKLNPDWWPDKNSQYGMLKKWRLDQTGTYIDGEKFRSMTIEDYHLAKNPFISVRIGVREDAVYRGGINIFGKNFGDYPQDIRLEIQYM
ncbi:ArsR/SmtB family transcription factor [Anaerobium acetethylicum]|uniref:Predicted transcriptional regulator n=1 Tax=Anaerobium acetethylicum TaxID=1619234 RepID=A0A1D3TQU8_9FIRM|nr:helix-turn-helix domain-containing protein [Anaerobium acetethylicum]SCP96000.1 Predicted transcriptional regulator [Anaerobium acetethylicum]